MQAWADLDPQRFAHIVVVVPAADIVSGAMVLSFGATAGSSMQAAYQSTLTNRMSGLALQIWQNCSRLYQHPLGHRSAAMHIKLWLTFGKRALHEWHHFAVKLATTSLSLADAYPHPLSVTLRAQMAVAALNSLAHRCASASHLARAHQLTQKPVQAVDRHQIFRHLLVPPLLLHVSARSSTDQNGKCPARRAIYRCALCRSQSCLNTCARSCLPSRRLAGRRLGSTTRPLAQRLDGACLPLVEQPSELQLLGADAKHSCICAAIWAFKQWLSGTTATRTTFGGTFVRMSAQRVCASHCPQAQLPANP